MHATSYLSTVRAALPVRFGRVQAVLVLLALVGIVLLATGAGRAQAEEMRGKLVRVAPEEKAFVVEDGKGDYWLFVTGPETTIHVQRREETLENLQPGWRVTVQYEKEGMFWKALRIDARPVYMSVKPEDEYALVQVFYATDRQPNKELILGWWWYARVYRGTAIAAIVTVVLLVILAWRRRPYLFGLLGLVGLAVTLVLGLRAATFVAQQTGGTVPYEELFGNGRSPTLHYGTCNVSMPRRHKLGSLESVSILRFEFVYDPTRHVSLQEVAPRTEGYFYDALRQTVAKSPRKEAFVFIHGYNVTFADAVRRTAQLAYDLEFDGAPICYSWPSQGKLLQYTVDEANVEWTEHDLKQFLSTMAARSGAAKIHLIAHSMGNRALTRSLRALASEPGYDPSRFQEIVLAAPDIDAEVVQRDIAPAMRQAGQRITLYASSRDEALGLSKQMHGYARAGESGEKLVVVPGIDTIDVSEIDTSLIGHSYYGDNTSLLADLFTLVQKNLPPDRRERLRPAVRNELPYWIFTLADPL